MREFRSAKELAFVTSARLEQVGSHDHLSVWVKHALVGTLTLELGEGATLAQRLGLQEHAAASEPPVGMPDLEWSPRQSTAPFGDIALAVQRIELETATRVWRCKHGAPLRMASSDEPECGCSVAHVVDELALQLHAELAHDHNVGAIEDTHASDSPPCAVCAIIVSFLRRVA
jgi:methyl coenzyme M reductase subunit C